MFLFILTADDNMQANIGASTKCIPCDFTSVNFVKLFEFSGCPQNQNLLAVEQNVNIYDSDGNISRFVKTPR